MLRIIRSEDGVIVSPFEYIEGSEDAYIGIDDMLRQLMELQAAGVIRIEPNGEALQRMAVKAELQRITAKEHGTDNMRRFISDRRGGRINRTAARFLELEAVHRNEAIMSIHRFMNVEGPAAFRSQAELLAILDPGINADQVASQAAEAVDRAVRQGIANGQAIGQTG